MIWIALSIGMLALLLFSLRSMSRQQDRAARRIEITRNPFSEVEFTITGSSGFIAPRAGSQAMPGCPREGD
jgi:hypothetical protein